MKKINVRKVLIVRLLPVLCMFILFACGNDEDFSDNGEINIDSPGNFGEGLKILVDASHGGGGWWFPQEGTYDPDKYHQGSPLANYFRQAGFTVDELGRGDIINDAVLEDYELIIRTGSYADYKPHELEAYQNVVDDGVCLLMITDHRTNALYGDKLAEMLGLEFDGSVIEYKSARGVPYSDVVRFADHAITEGIELLDRIPAASALMNAEENKNIRVLGWFSEDAYVDLNYNGIRDSDEPTGMPYMGLLEHPRSRIFFLTDINKFEFMPAPLVENLGRWFVKQHNFLPD